MVAEAPEKELDTMQKFLISKRIACPEAGYPASEARYLDLEEYIEKIITDAIEHHYGIDHK